MDKIILAQKLARINDHWNPRVIAELNGQQVKLVKFQGEFPWHNHEDEDELFMVLSGSFMMEFRDKKVLLQPNEILVVPRGVEHRPIADDEASVLLFEPASTINTGNERNNFTREKPEEI